MYSKVIKRILDFFAAFVALVIFSPVIIILIILLAIVNNGKPFFLQKRPGKNEEIFTIIKFKTMKDPKDKESELVDQAQRITKIGGFVRKYSLDELLQVINVLKGDMSMVGPRPLLIEYLPLYTKEQNRRHLVTPGITGWAQVMGRNTMPWDERFACDVWYVDNISFSIDMKILWKTVLKIFHRDQIASVEQDPFIVWDGKS